MGQSSAVLKSAADVFKLHASLREHKAHMAKTPRRQRILLAAVFAVISLLFAFGSVLDVSQDASASRYLELSLKAPQPLERENQTNGQRSSQSSDCAALHYSLPGSQALPLFAFYRRGSRLPLSNASALNGLAVAVLLRPPISQS